MLPVSGSKRKIKKVMLINPPTTVPSGLLKILVPPLGILYLAAMLKDYDVQVLDAPMEGYRNEKKDGDRNITYGLDFKEIKERIVDFPPDLVGITCHSSLQFINCIEACRIVKSISSTIITVIGGSHPTLYAKDILYNFSIVDFIILNEGEYSFRDLLKELNSENCNLTKIDGFAYRENNKVIVNPKTKLIDNLDEIPFPARELVPIEKYFKINMNQNLSFVRRSLPILSSRGCPYNCVFCFTTKYWQNSYRYRSPNNVLEEIDYLVDKYRIREIHFTDDSLTSNYDRSYKMFEMLKNRKYKIRWATPNGVNATTLDGRLLKIMKESGCYEIRLAIESGNEVVLHKMIRKPIKLDHVEKLIKEAKKLGLTTSIFLSFGYPDETLDQINQTFAFARKIKPDSVFLSIATPLPGTDLMEICKERGYIKEEHNFRKAAFANANYDTENFSRREIEEIYFREAFLLNLGLISRNPKAFIQRWGALIYNHPGFVLKFLSNFFFRTRQKEHYNVG